MTTDKVNGHSLPKIPFARCACGEKFEWFCINFIGKPCEKCTKDLSDKEEAED